jgi:ABC-type uncharacterized transport system substrate-binding protein
LAGKSVELFRDMLPSARRVGVLGHPTNPVFAKAMLDEVLVAGRPTGLEIQPGVMIRGPDEFETALTTMVREHAVVVHSLAVKSLTDMAIKYRLPMASTTRAFADVGGLMSFGAWARSVPPLLRARRERPCRRAAEQCDERAPP